MDHWSILIRTAAKHPATWTPGGKKEQKISERTNTDEATYDSNIDIRLFYLIYDHSNNQVDFSRAARESHSSELRSVYRGKSPDPSALWAAERSVSETFLSSIPLWGRIFFGIISIFNICWNERNEWSERAIHKHRISRRSGVTY